MRSVTLVLSCVWVLVLFVGTAAAGEHDINQLISALSDNSYDVVWEAGRTLEQIGAEAIPYLEELLVQGGGNARARQHAARIIGSIGSNLNAAALTAVLEDDASEVRIAALNALSKVVDQSSGKAVIPKLSGIVKNDLNSEARKSALELLAKIGIESEEAVTALAVGIDDRVLQVFLAAMRIMRSNAQNIHPLLLDMLKSDNEEYQWAAAMLIGRDAASRWTKVVPDLVKLVNSEDTSYKLRREALHTLTLQSNILMDDLSAEANVNALVKWIGIYCNSPDFSTAQFVDSVRNLMTVYTKEHGGIPTLDNPGDWELVFSDDFLGDSLDLTLWNYNYPWGTGHTHNHRAYMIKENAVVADGILTIKAENERHPQAPEFVEHDGIQYLDFTSGIVTTFGKFHFTYGYIEARIKVSGTKGFWPAFWLLGDGWPPEVDIMEVLTRNPKELHINYHYGPSWNNKWSHYQKFTVDDLSADFFVYGFEWMPTYMKWYLNGEEIGSAFTNQEWIAQSQNMYILLNLAVGGWGGDPDDTTKWPGIMEVDWVRVWQQKH